MMPTTDLITKKHATYDVTTSSRAVGDSVLARTSMSYLGKYTDPVTGTTVKSDFLTQFYCIDGQNFPGPETQCEGVSAYLYLYIDKFVGDTLTNMKIEVYELDSLLDANADYYTNIAPEKYVNKGAKPVGTKWFTIADRSIPQSSRDTVTYSNHISIPLDKGIAQDIISGYLKDTTITSSASKWLKSGLRGSRGLYVKLTNGDGIMTYIYMSQLSIGFKYRDLQKDTIMSGFVNLAGTEEVIQATRFENSNLEKLMADTEATYIKSPAGIFTMAEFPIDQINFNDTINSAAIKFTRYNDSSYSDAGENRFRLGIPKTILMVRLDDYLNGFFEKYNVADNITSYTTTFSSSTNTYEFQNISHLLTKMIQEKQNGTASDNYNKVLLIPVETTTNSQSAIVKINHDFSMSSARLVGGTKDKVQLEVIYSKFNSDY